VGLGDFRFLRMKRSTFLDWDDENSDAAVRIIGGRGTNRPAS
jgi:hypothetical protein